MSYVRSRNRRLPGKQLGIALIVAVWATALASAQDHEVDLSELMRETQLESASQDRLTMVWWLPEEYWRASAEASLPEGMAERFLSVLRPYVLLGVVDGTLGPMGGASFRDPEELEGVVVLVDKGGERHSPLPEERLSPDARNFLAMSKPMFANMLGPMGENLGFFFFSAFANDGARIADARKEGGFSVEVGDQVFEWRTPLASVLPPRFCPVDQEEMSGAWKYCPWHGAELVPREELGAPPSFPPEPGPALHLLPPDDFDLKRAIVYGESTSEIPVVAAHGTCDSVELSGPAFRVARLVRNAREEDHALDAAAIQAQAARTLSVYYHRKPSNWRQTSTPTAAIRPSAHEPGNPPPQRVPSSTLTCPRRLPLEVVLVGPDDKKLAPIETPRRVQRSMVNESGRLRTTFDMAATFDLEKALALGHDRGKLVVVVSFDDGPAARFKLDSKRLKALTPSWTTPDHASRNR